MGVLVKGHTFADNEQVTSTKVNNLVDNATFSNDAVDDSTIQISSNKLAVKTINTGQIANSAVTTAKIGDSQVTTAKIGDSQVTTAKIGDSQVTTAKIADANITQAKLATNIAGTGACFFAYNNSTFNASNNTNTPVPLDAEFFDLLNNFNTSTYKFVAPVTGYYYVTASATCNSGAAFLGPLVFQNNVQVLAGDSSSAVTFRSSLSGIIQVDANDEIQLYVIQASGTLKTINTCNLSIALVRSA